MFLFGINFSCYYLLLLRQFRSVFKDEELRMYVGVAVLFFVMMGIFIVLLEKSRFGHGRLASRLLKITVPEDLDYEELFDDILDEYSIRWDLVRVRTTNMGTLFELTYDVQLKDVHAGKQFIDDLRCRNGNLGIMFSREIEKELI